MPLSPQCLIWQRFAEPLITSYFSPPLSKQQSEGDLHSPLQPFTHHSPLNARGLHDLLQPLIHHSPWYDKMFAKPIATLHSSVLCMKSLHDPSKPLIHHSPWYDKMFAKPFTTLHSSVLWMRKVCTTSHNPSFTTVLGMTRCLQSLSQPFTHQSFEWEKLARPLTTPHSPQSLVWQDVCKASHNPSLISPLNARSLHNLSQPLIHHSPWYDKMFAKPLTTLHSSVLWMTKVCTTSHSPSLTTVLGMTRCLQSLSQPFSHHSPLNARGLHDLSQPLIHHSPSSDKMFAKPLTTLHSPQSFWHDIFANPLRPALTIVLGMVEVCKAYIFYSPQSLVRQRLAQPLSTHP